VLFLINFKAKRYQSIENKKSQIYAKWGIVYQRYSHIEIFINPFSFGAEKGRCKNFKYSKNFAGYFDFN